MAALKDVLAQKIPAYRDEVRKLIAEHGDTKISDVTVAQAYGGMRGVKSLVCDTSTVSPDHGVLLRGKALPEVQDRLPEEIFWLLLTGEFPDAASLKQLQQDLADRSEVPQYVLDMLRGGPIKEMHPMAMQSMALLALERGSQFAKRYAAGLPKEEYWEWCLEDALDLLAKLPVATAAIYRIRYKDGELIDRDPQADWATSFARMLGVPDPAGSLAELMRLYLTIHSDHEGGNVSANLCHETGSALSDPFYAVSAGINGLAGPLHGLANQNALKFHLEIHEQFGGVPSPEELEKFLWARLESGRVIPGFGHAVLRCTDPRYTACHEFAQRACADAPLVKLAALMLEIVPRVLTEHGHAKNPNPNVDALSGVLMYTCGVTEPPFYTAIFGVSRAIGMCAQLVLNRAIGSPITRPKSVTTDWIRQHVTAG